MAAKKKPKRILLVNRDFQIRYTKAAIGVALVSTVLTCSVILYPLYTFEILRIPKFLPVPILLAMVAAAFINVGLIGFFGFLITHKLAGPAYALSREFYKITNGRLGSQLKVRDGDELKYLVRTFNEMSEALAASTKVELEKAQDLEKKTREFIEGNSSVKDSEAASSLLEEVSAMCLRLQSRIPSA